MISEPYDVERETKLECISCLGSGNIDWGDPEDGVTIECPQCLGEGFVEYRDKYE